MRYTDKCATRFVLLLLFFLSAAPSNAQDASFEAAKRVPVSIHTAMAGGFWTHGKEEGFFRVIVIAGGVEHVAHRLYIQWLRTDADKQDYELIRTVNVKELNLGQGHILKVKTAFGDLNAFKVDVAANSRGGKTSRFVIRVKGNGKYVIKSR